MTSRAAGRKPGEVGLDRLDRARADGDVGPARAGRRHDRPTQDQQIGSGALDRRGTAEEYGRQGPTAALGCDIERRVAVREVVVGRVGHRDVGLDRDPRVVGRALLVVGRRDVHVQADRPQRRPPDVAVHVRAAAHRLADEDRARLRLDLGREIAGRGERQPTDQHDEPPGPIDRRILERLEELPVACGCRRRRCCAGRRRRARPRPARPGRGLSSGDRPRRHDLVVLDVERLRVLEESPPDPFGLVVEPHGISRRQDERKGIGPDDVIRGRDRLDRHVARRPVAVDDARTPRARHAR